MLDLAQWRVGKIPGVLHSALRRPPTSYGTGGVSMNVPRVRDVLVRRVSALHGG